MLPRRLRTGAVLAVLAYAGFATAIAPASAPWLMPSFGLDQRGLATLFAGISLSAIAVLGLARLLDRFGRRRVLLACLAGMPMAALGAALARTAVPFALATAALHAFAGAAVAGATALLAETLPDDRRAAGIGHAGMALGLGSGLAFLAVPWIAATALSWRWLPLAAAAGLVAWPAFRHALPESERWRRRADRPVATRRVGRRALPMLASALLTTLAVTAAGTWRYLHAVSVVGLSPAAASAVVVGAGALATAGFPLGSRVAERVGRVATVVAAGLLVAASAAAAYWGPPAGAFPAVWVGAGFLVFGLAANALAVAGGTAATEQFPTALRGTMLGWFALTGAVAQVGAQAVIAALAPRAGGISAVVGWLALAAVPGVLVFGVTVAETRGLALEVASGERTP